jgi:hypothetical protein
MGKKINPDTWIEVFGGDGIVTDQFGRKVDAKDIIGKTMAFYSGDSQPGTKLVLGHRSDEDIHFGGVESFKSYERDGKQWLLIKPQGVDADFAKQVNDEWYPERSIRVNQDTGEVEHVAFMPAKKKGAVQGMLPAQFQKNDENILQFSTYFTRTIFQRLRDWLVKKEGLEEAEDIIPQWALDDMLADSVREEKHKEVPLGFSEEEDDLGMTPEEVEKIREEALAEGIEKGKEETAAQFAAQEKERAKETADRETEALIDKKIADGKWKPAIKPLALSFMKGLDHAEVLEFAEADGKVTKETQREQAVRLIDELAEPMPTAEFADQEKEGQPLDKNDAGSLLKKAKTYQFQQAEIGNKVNINEAMQHVVGGEK